MDNSRSLLRRSQVYAETSGSRIFVHRLREFVLMKELRLQDALATDSDFRVGEFNPLLAR
jgi:hypothetical protein